MKSKWANPSGTRTYYAWRSMRHRCTNENNPAWANYGGRGIKVCDRWMDDYDAFFSDMGACPAGMSLDRANVDEGYSPDNCRWVNWAAQANNKRTSVLLTVSEETMSAAQWSEKLGVKRATIYARVKRYKMDAKNALDPRLQAERRPDAVCGTRGGYHSGCRCAACQGFNTQRARDYRAKKRALGAEIAAGAV